MEYLIAIVLVYLYAAIPFSLLIGFAYGVDIRKTGSGNIGGTNLSRSCGKKSFIAAFILDGSKGVMAMVIAAILGLNPVLLFPFAILGHSYSVFIKFKGGKGVATSFGFAFAYAPIPAIIAIITFLIVLKISKFVSLSSIIGVIAFTIVAQFYFTEPLPKLLSVVMAVVMIFLHRTNVKRIFKGEENKVTWI